MNWELIGGICAIIGVIYLCYQFHYLPEQETKEFRNNMLAQFRTSQILITQLINDLEHYTLENDGNIIFSDNMSIKGYIRYLKDMQQAELTEDMYARLRDEPLTKQNIITMADSLKAQIHSFNKSKAYFQSNFKYS